MSQGSTGLDLATTCGERSRRQVRIRMIHRCCGALVTRPMTLVPGVVVGWVVRMVPGVVRDRMCRSVAMVTGFRPMVRPLMETCPHSQRLGGAEDGEEHESGDHHHRVPEAGTENHDGEVMA